MKKMDLEKMSIGEIVCELGKEAGEIIDEAFCTNEKKICCPGVSLILESAAYLIWGEKEMKKKLPELLRKLRKLEMAVIAISVYSAQEIKIDISDKSIAEVCKDYGNPIVKSGDKIVSGGGVEFFVVGVAKHPRSVELDSDTLLLWTSMEKDVLVNLDFITDFTLP